MITRWHKQDRMVASGKRWYPGIGADGEMDHMAITHGIAIAHLLPLISCKPAKKNPITK